MSDFAPPTGPPPPHVPEGWKAIWNAQYQEYFYVNLHTKQSTWEKPTEPATQHHSSDEMPPGYTPGSAVPVGAGHDMKKVPLESNNPYSQNVAESDEAYARRLQEEENARLHAPGGSESRVAGGGHYDGGVGPGAGGYDQGYQQQGHGYQQQQQGYGQQGAYSGTPDYAQSQQQRPGTDRGKSGGLFGKLKDKLAQGSSGGGSRPMGMGMGSSMLGGGRPHQYGGYPQQGYGGYPQQGYGGGYGQSMYGQPVKRKAGMGAGGAAALGVGGGLVGGMLLADAMDDSDHGGYDDDGGDMGDMGGGDF